MRKGNWIGLLLFSVTMLAATLSPGSAWANGNGNGHGKDCGDTSGNHDPDDRRSRGGTDVPCDCGDTVTTDTVLDSSDPVLSTLCFPVGLFVAEGVRLGGVNIQCRKDDEDDSESDRRDDDEFAVGLFIIGDEVKIVHGTLRNCGIFGFTSESKIERVSVSDASSAGIFLIGEENKLLHNRCDRNKAGIVVVGEENLLERNICKHNKKDGILVVGSENQLNTNQGRGNGGQGVVAVGGEDGDEERKDDDKNRTDKRNYGDKNGEKPDCEIDGRSVPGTGGRIC
jgi:hypothetical protein